MKKSLKAIIVVVIVVAGLLFIRSSFKTASPPPEVAETPELADAPVRLYGTVEPAGREVYVSPPMTKQVVEMYVKEGDEVTMGQRLCDLEHSVEKAEVELARSRVSLAQKNLELRYDELKRAEKLYKKRVDTEFKFTQARLQHEMELRKLKVAKYELQVAKTKLEQTMLRSPMYGIVYKFDVRRGETIAAGDNTKIILGAPGYWVRLAVESFWKGKVRIGAACTIYDTETREELGTGKVIARTPYMGRRDFRTEDLQERFDTKFQEVIVQLEPGDKIIPINLSVVAELQ